MNFYFEPCMHTHPYMRKSIDFEVSANSVRFQSEDFLTVHYGSVVDHDVDGADLRSRFPFRKNSAEHGSYTKVYGFLNDLYETC